MRAVIDYLDENSSKIPCPYGVNEFELSVHKVSVLVTNDYNNIKLPGLYNVVIIRQVDEYKFTFNLKVNRVEDNNVELYNSCLNNKIIVYSSKEDYEEFKDFLNMTVTKFKELDSVTALYDICVTERVLLLNFGIDLYDMGIELMSSLKRAILNDKTLVVDDTVFKYLFDNISRFDIDLSMIRLPSETVDTEL